MNPNIINALYRKYKMHNLITPEPFTEEIMEKARRMRSSLPLPTCLDSPFFLARFLRAHGGDEDVARKRVEEYLSHRQTLGYADLSDMEIFTEFPIGKATYSRFCISRVDRSVRSGDVHVFVHKMEGTDLKEIMKVIPLSYVLHSYFMLHEVFGRAVAETEKRTGRPSSVVTILDLKGLNLSEFLNPLSAPVQLARLVVKVWSEYFSDNMCKLLLINPPGIVSLMFKISKFIMDSRTANKLAFLNDVSELQNYLEPQAIPEEYGGTMRDDSGYAVPPEGCTHPLLPVLSSEHRGCDDVWTDHGILKPPASKTYNIKSHQDNEIIKKCTQSGRLIWNFTISGDVDFEIVKRESGKEVQVWPKVTLTSLKLPEYGSVAVNPGEYVIRIRNPSTTWFPVKVTGAADFKAE
ncbi:CRAL/TRIO domain protein [Ancylostoma duodenale]|uniref:CRAL/TRIO domain protein n=1 Tax=Ancylostoma duodenale TaxID=51022 RepID=A0A0C2FTV3_9BILA|nr:CRAL/TRIO domain protein [Ancylostoma duodenale]